MSSLNRGMSYSPDFNMQGYQYYNVNAGSAGRISTNSDFLTHPQPSPPYYGGNLGSTWPKMPQPAPQYPGKQSLGLPARNEALGRSQPRDNDKQKQKFALNFTNILSGKDKRTALMIKNIPNKYNQTMLVQELDEKHKGLYDCLYLPIDPKNRCNCGYAFINVVHPIIILSLYLQFNGKSWRNFNSEKICELAYARLQGKSQLLKQLEGSGVMQQSDPAKKPLILDTVEPEEELLEKIKNEFEASYSFP